MWLLGVGGVGYYLWSKSQTSAAPSPNPVMAILNTVSPGPATAPTAAQVAASSADLDTYLTTLSSITQSGLPSAQVTTQLNALYAQVNADPALLPSDLQNINNNIDASMANTPA